MSSHVELELEKSETHPIAASSLFSATAASSFSSAMPLSSLWSAMAFLVFPTGKVVQQ